MYPVKYMAALTTAACLLLLAACGGGGGDVGDGPTTSRPDLPSEPPFGDTVPANETELLAAAGGSLYSLVPTMKVGAGGSSLAVGPDVANVNSRFDGEHLVVTLDRSGADDIRLDSANVIYDSKVRQAFVFGLPNRSWRLRRVFDSTSNSATFGDVFVDWFSTDPADYVAGGFWMHAGTSSADWEFGAFVDGPELSLSDRPVLPTSGTASYEGEAHLLATAVKDGEIIAQYRPLSTSRLTVDFLGGTIEGCLVCTNHLLHISVGRVAFDRSTGTFQGSDLTVTGQARRYFQSGGRWTGRFSNIPDSSGAPRLAAGAFRATALELGTTTTTHSFFGVFGAGRTQ